MSCILNLLQELRSLMRAKDIEHWAMGRTLYAVCQSSRRIIDDRTMDLGVWKSQRLSILNAAEFLPDEHPLRIRHMAGGFRVYARYAEWHRPPYINLVEYRVTDCGRYAVIDNETIRRRQVDCVYRMTLLLPVQPYMVGKRGNWVFGPAHGLQAIVKK